MEEVSKHFEQQTKHDALRRWRLEKLIHGNSRTPATLSAKRKCRTLLSVLDPRYRRRSTQLPERITGDPARSGIARLTNAEAAFHRELMQV